MCESVCVCVGSCLAISFYRQFVGYGKGVGHCIAPQLMSCDYYVCECVCECASVYGCTCHRNVRTYVCVMVSMAATRLQATWVQST